MDATAMYSPLLDLTQPLDLALLENCVATATTSSAYTASPQFVAAQAVLTQLKELPDAWMRVPDMLERATTIHTKFYALSLLEDTVKRRWHALPADQRSGIRAFVAQMIMRMSAEGAGVGNSPNRPILMKLDVVLVQILKHDWTESWGTFVPEIVEAAKGSEAICENTMAILKMLSEEIFDFSKGELTSREIVQLKTRFEAEFALVYQFCEWVLQTTRRSSLIQETLASLRAFLAWVPPRYVYETKLLETLVVRLFSASETRVGTVQVLAEIASINIADDLKAVAGALIVEYFKAFIAQLQSVLPLSMNLRDLFDQGDDDTTTFILYLAMFLSQYLRNFASLLEATQAHWPYLVEAHRYLIAMLRINDKEVFKIVAEYFLYLSSDLYAEIPAHGMNQSPTNQNQPFGLRSFRQPTAPVSQSRIGLYNQDILRQLRVSLITNMPKPEEVLVTHTDTGDVKKERLTDVDVIATYKTVKDTLIYLTHLDHSDMRSIVRAKLDAQRDRTEWSWDNLNKLCWAIGSISGAFDEETEKEFLVDVIRELLELCEHTQGKENKAVIAANIMYVVGQYPRFLVNHWRFLKTVVNKVFEFMHESFPGVQEMAVETFVKIAKRCRRKFVVTQTGDSRPFVEDIIQDLPIITSDLRNEENHVDMFYEAVGYMIQQAPSIDYRYLLVSNLMAPLNSQFSSFLLNTPMLTQVDVLRALGGILKINIAVCTSAEAPNFVKQASTIFLDLMQLYRLYGTMINQSVQTRGEAGVQFIEAKLARRVKKLTLNLLNTLFDSDQVNEYCTPFLSPLLDAVLGDYLAAASPVVRDEEVLALLTVLVERVTSSAMIPFINGILDASLEPTLSMITADLHSNPGHRLHLFRLLRAIAGRCFRALFSSIHQRHFKNIVDLALWAMKHTDREAADTGLTMLVELLENLDTLFPGHTVQQFHSAVSAAYSQPLDTQVASMTNFSAEQQIAVLFYQSYLVPILEATLEVMTDGAHKAGFKYQTTVVMHICHAVALGRVPGKTVPELAAYLKDVISRGFGNMARSAVATFVDGLFNVSLDRERFKTQLRDFLVQMKQFAGADELFEEERQEQLRREQARREQVPGLAGPSADDYRTGLLPQ